MNSRERLGGYQILDLPGVGEMGEVYRARGIAIKILPDEFTHDSDRVARLRVKSRQSIR